jgi:hypothetical protein
MRDREQFRREVPCRDTAGRARRLQVFVTEMGNIAFQAPPGEVAQLAPSDIGVFQAIVNEAHIVAIRVRQSVPARGERRSS